MPIGEVSPHMWQYNHLSPQYDEYINTQTQFCVIENAVFVNEGEEEKFKDKTLS